MNPTDLLVGARLNDIEVFSHVHEEVAEETVIGDPEQLFVGRDSFVGEVPCPSQLEG